MRVVKGPEEFVPFTITLQIETPQDAADLHFLANYTPLTNTLKGWGVASIDVRECIVDKTGIPSTGYSGDGFRIRRDALLKRVSVAITEGPGGM